MIIAYINVTSGLRYVVCNVFTQRLMDFSWYGEILSSFPDILSPKLTSNKESEYDLKHVNRIKKISNIKTQPAAGYYHILVSHSDFFLKITLFHYIRRYNVSISILNCSSN